MFRSERIFPARALNWLGLGVAGSPSRALARRAAPSCLYELRNAVRTGGGLRLGRPEGSFGPLTGATPQGRWSGGRARG